MTGASSGIGEATALALADQGAAVALAARRKDRIDALAARIADAGGTALAIQSDVTSQEQAEALVEQTVADLGRLDTLVNNAGVMLLGPIVDAPLEEWEQMIDVNVKGLLYCAHAALPHLLTRRRGQPAAQVADMVNISSVAGRVARSGSGVYNAHQVGRRRIQRVAAPGGDRRHVRVSLVEPGAVATELSPTTGPRSASRWPRFDDFERMESEDIADAIAYIVTRPWRMAVNEMLIRPTEQER